MSDTKQADLLAGVSDQQFDEMTRVTFAVMRVSADDPLNETYLRGLAEQRAPDPSIFEERPPWFGRFVAATYALDSYFTRMDDQTTLKNYAADINEGRALLIGHNTQAQNLGMSLRGKYEAHGYKTEESPAGIPWTWGDYYLLRGKEPQDSVIESFRAGTQDRFSVGFSPGWWRCSIDRMDLFSWDCPHIPGRYYDKNGKPTDDRETGTLATADVVDAHLRELSTVYSNATPGATLLKAQRMVESGAVREWKEIRFLESIYRHKMPGTERVYPAAKPEEREATVEGDGKETSGEKAPENVTATQVQGVELGLVIDRAELAALGLPQDATASALIDAFKTHRANAEQVTAYRGEAIKDAIHEGKRALGTHFNEERQTKMLGGLDIPDITAQRREWAEIAQGMFGNGRVTEEQADEEPARTKTVADRREAGRNRSAAPLIASRS